MGNNYHITKNQSGGWDARKDGSVRSSFHGETQKEAEKAAKEFLSNSGGGEVRIHGLDGRIRDSDTVKPANDPCPPKDKIG